MTSMSVNAWKGPALACAIALTMDITVALILWASH
jgi:hypothetical protein